MSAAPPNQHLGRVLGGQYRVEALLGYGGMGAVYRGVQLSVQRAVAIKLMASGHTNPEQTYLRFRREAEATARLAHPNTVRVIDFGVTESHELYMVMELLEGCDLAARLKQGPVPLSEALLIVRQVLAALCEAHALGIVHRDLKPGNVFLSRVHGGESFVKVMDFGIAGIAPGPEAQKLTVTGAVMGTPAYMSPEQAQSKPVDARSDLYSIGVMLFEMLTGKPPFEADTLVSMLIAHVTQPPKRLAEAGVHIPELGAVQALMDRLLAKQPGDRPASAVEVAQQIDALLAGTHVHSLPMAQTGHSATAALPNQSRPLTPLQWDRTQGTPRRARGAWIVVSLATLAGLGTGAAFWFVRAPSAATLAVKPAAPSPPIGSAAPPPVAAAPPQAPGTPAGAAAVSGEPASPTGVVQPSAPEPIEAALPDSHAERSGRHRRNAASRRSTTHTRDEIDRSEAASPEEPEPQLQHAASNPSASSAPARLDLNRAPPFPSMTAAKKALDGGKINAATYESAIALLKARRTQRVALERENLQKGQITPQEYEWRLGRIDAEYRGE